jgi:UDP-2,3-diacylglucosamine pyrophosphatase LpxH
MQKRKLQLVVISDVHLGTYGCHAKELKHYLESIAPETLILNGDIIDIWQFSKNYWPKSHMKVIRQILKLSENGTKVYYIPGNHDEMLRKFEGLQLGNITVCNKVLMDLNGKTAWFFHGDVFDVCMQHSKWLTRLGAKGYDLLILINSFVNFILKQVGHRKISLSKRIKNSVKSAVKYINNFEITCAEIAIENKYDYVVCGHIHHPEIREIKTKEGQVTYLNSGDWIENLSALEYNNNEWEIFKMQDIAVHDEEEYQTDKNVKQLYKELLLEFKIEGF